MGGVPRQEHDGLPAAWTQQRGERVGGSAPAVGELRAAAGTESALLRHLPMFSPPDASESGK